MTDESRNDDRPKISVSGRRWPIIIVFAMYSLTSAFQWIQFAIIPSLFTTYYDVSLGAISWTSMIYMATFIPLVFPATYLIDNTGMRNVALIGAGMNAVGTVIKCFAIHPDMFWLAFIGQTIAACAQCLILEMPPKIAAIWFPSKEVSTATSFGVFGNQLGVALGFLIPPLIIAGPIESFRGVANPSDEVNGTDSIYDGTFPDDWRNETHWSGVTEAATSEVTNQIRLLFFTFAGICVFLLLLVVLLFQDKPPKPANRASIRRSVREDERTDSTDSTDRKDLFLKSVREYAYSISRLLRQGSFVLLVLSYGLNVGVYYALSTLLNQVIKPTFLDNTDDYTEEFVAGLDVKIGQMGTIMVIAGLVGALLGGLILDRFKKFKLTTLWTYMLTLLFMICFTWMVDKENLMIDFLFIGVLGFFMTGYLPIGFEFGAELTYPESEATSSGLLNCSAQIFGLIVTQLCQSIIEYFARSDENEMVGAIKGGWYANVTMIGCLIVGLGLTALIKEDLKRQAVENEPEYKTSSSEGEPDRNENTKLLQPA